MLMSSLDFSWKNEAEVKLNGYILHIFSTKQECTLQCIYLQELHMGGKSGKLQKRKIQKLIQHKYQTRIYLLPKM